MAVPVNPDDPGGGPGGGDPGASSTPPTDPSAKLAFQVTSTNITITSDQITAAGGPWPSFTVKVTPINANGSGASASVDVTVAAPTPAPTPT